MVEEVALAVYIFRMPSEEIELVLLEGLDKQRGQLNMTLSDSNTMLVRLKRGLGRGLTDMMKGCRHGEAHALFRSAPAPLKSTQ